MYKEVYRSKVYDISNTKGLKEMEKEQQRLYKKYNKVETIQVGIEKYQFVCSYMFVIYNN